MKKSIVGIIFILVIASCKTTNYTPASYKDSQLVIGTTGGVTGAIKEYILFENGQLFLSKGITGQWKALKNVKGTRVRDFFRQAESLGLDTLKFDHPGNVTYYLILKANGKENTIKWGESGHPVAPEIQLFYKELIAEF